MTQLVSLIIRTLNEERYLEELLRSIKAQKINGFSIEVVIVDSGSTDQTLNIAQKYDCRITYISKNEFTFGKSLNVGCEFAQGEYLVFVSGHCIPVDFFWLQKLILPISQDIAVYTYGRQIGRDTTKFSENILFEKYFPPVSRAPQAGFFCNNANAAIKRKYWEEFKFNEELTGLEDMYLAQQLTMSKKKIGYLADAVVYHIHDETWRQIGIRYEREAVALQKIMPELHFGLLDFCKCFCVGIIKDSRVALNQGVLLKEFKSIVCFRLNQYWGVYRGSHVHRQLSKERKAKYFYPRITDMDVTNDK